MFEEFSSGYYLGRLYVEPYGGDAAVLDSTAHAYVEEELYDADDADCPLVMKVDTAHFRVAPEGAVPSETLAVPRDWLPDGADAVPDRERRRVFLAKRDTAEQLFQMGAV